MLLVSTYVSPSLGYISIKNSSTAVLSWVVNVRFIIFSTFFLYRFLVITFFKHLSQYWSDRLPTKNCWVHFFFFFFHLFSSLRDKSAFSSYYRSIPVSLILSEKKKLGVRLLSMSDVLLFRTTDSLLLVASDNELWKY